jgi:hypothetical protein
MLSTQVPAHLALRLTYRNRYRATGQPLWFIDAFMRAGAEGTNTIRQSLGEDNR